MTILKISIIHRVHIGVWQASETISRIDLLILPQNLLSWGAPISVGPSCVLPGDWATNLESPLMSLSQPSPYFFVSKSCSFCFHILSRTQPLLPSSPAAAAITHSACRGGLFRPLPLVLLTAVRRILFKSKSWPVAPLFTALTWLFSHSESLQGPKKPHLVWPPWPLCSHLPTTVCTLTPSLTLPGSFLFL